ncbi:pyridoxal phosphate-dependent decarboxylase family protein [Marinicrinis sediminis]|uniref:Pyridoxal phosphate-dependent decarboxylase family protein n=1 Tax=Marinicrinis sediminis TaxID=1652465 RepID=A0ABW5RCD4_9BACL
MHTEQTVIPGNWTSRFLNGAPESQEQLEAGVQLALQKLSDHFTSVDQPYSGATVSQLREQIRAESSFPVHGRSLEEAMKLIEPLLQHAVAVHHPKCAAHLHCPPLIPAIAAELLVGATNQSMDSWDQSPAATLLEQELVQWLCALFAYDCSVADGVFTSGGTQSNLMGLLYARDAFTARHWNWNVHQQGLHPDSHQLRILCSHTAHFTVRQSASLLGLGEAAVIPIQTDHTYRMCMNDLDLKLEEMARSGAIPFAIVATAGTTDFGAIDPIEEIARRTQNRGIWLHVDAAYGGALMLSEKHRHRLQGVEAADSITVDFHKLFYQPISCGAFLMKDRQHFRLNQIHADYLNPVEDEWSGIPNLVNKSLQTTRRFDALKLYLSLQVTGTSGMAEMIEHTMDMAGVAAREVEADPVFEWLHTPALNALTFRYRCQGNARLAREVSVSNELENAVNHQIPERLIHQGVAVIAQTKVGQKACLKLTLLNPLLTRQDVLELLDAIKSAGWNLEQQLERDIDSIHKREWINHS